MFGGELTGWMFQLTRSRERDNINGVLDVEVLVSTHVLAGTRLDSR